MAEKFIDAPALRESVSCKVGLVGPSGAGKTTSALLMAYGICGDWRKILMVDTEGDSGTHPCGQTFDGTAIPGGAGCAPDQTFRRLALGPPYHPSRMVEVIDQYENEKLPDGSFAIECIVWDSMSHVWNGAGGTLETVDKIGSANGWKTMTPLFRKFVDKVRLSRLHFVATMRTKTEMEYVTKTDDQGKSKVVEIKKLGLKAVMRDDVDYEFTTIIRLDMNHLGTADKDRTREFSDRPPAIIGVETGKILSKWSRGGVSEIGSPAWMESKLDILANYAGSLDGLRTLWAGVAQHRARIPNEVWDRLFAAKEEGKARLIKLGRTE
jgi:hypothetical protein